MGRKSSTNDAVVKDAQIKCRKEDCASGMVHRLNDATVQDAQIKHSVEECVKGTGLIANRKTNLPHSDQNLNSLLQLKHLTELPGLPSEDKKKVLFLRR